MRTVFDNRQCAHVWAQQNQPRGRSNNGSLYFEGPTIYSYGEHFPLACFIDDARVLVNKDSYSPTTGKHQSYVRQAIDHKERVYVSTEVLKAFLWGYSFNTRMSDRLIKEGKNAIAAAIDKAAARRIKKKKADDISYGLAKLDAIAAVFTAFGQPIPAELITLRDKTEGDAAEIIAARKLQLEEEKRQKEERDRQEQEAIEAAIKSHWLNHLPMSETGHSIYGSKRVYMRVNGDEIETTKGARFPVDHARLAFLAIRAMKETNQTYENDGSNKAYHLGHYRIDKIDDQGNVTAGCHFVEWPQIEHCARILGIYP